MRRKLFTRLFKELRIEKIENWDNSQRKENIMVTIMLSIRKLKVAEHTITRLHFDNFSRIFKYVLAICETKKNTKKETKYKQIFVLLR